MHLLQHSEELRAGLDVVDRAQQRANRSQPVGFDRGLQPSRCFSFSAR